MMNSWLTLMVIIAAVFTVLMVHTFQTLKLKIGDSERLGFWKVLIVYFLLNSIRYLAGQLNWIPDDLNIQIGTGLLWLLGGFVIYYINVRYLD